MKNDYQQFTSNKESAPKDVANKVMSLVQQELNPSLKIILMKLCGLHLLAGLSSLFFCHQFGHGVHRHDGIMGPLMKYGESVCLFACGAFFFVGTTLLLFFLLNADELRVMTKNRYLALFTLIVFSLSAFVCTGSTEVLTQTTLFWIAGATVIWLAGLNFGITVKRVLTFSH
jgi:hypothetical protein